MTAQPTTVLHCKDCGEEMQIVGDYCHVDVDEMAAEWNDSHADCGKPAQSAAWEKLAAESDNRFVQVAGDASKLPGMPPRPSWSHPGNDVVQAANGWYRSEPVDVPLYNLDAIERPGGDVEYSALTACAVVDHLGKPRVALGWIRVFDDGPTRRGGFELDTATARRYAACLIAAADLAESEVTAC